MAPPPQVLDLLPPSEFADGQRASLDLLRTLWALGHTVENSTDGELRDWAQRWYDTALPHCAKFASPRTIAFMMLGAAAVMRARPGHRASRLQGRGPGRLPGQRRAGRRLAGEHIDLERTHRQ